MAREIERKFLVCGEGWRAGKSQVYRQGYLSTDNERTVRVRTAGERAFLTVKGVTRGATRAEFDYQIPADDAREMLDTLCLRPLIEKKRYLVEYDGLTWEVDEFLGDNHGLILAEIELDSEDQVFKCPDWVGSEVTGDSRYYNASLVAHPYSEWRDD